jgi:hypothetical protein
VEFYAVALELLESAQPLVAAQPKLSRKHYEVLVNGKIDELRSKLADLARAIERLRAAQNSAKRVPQKYIAPRPKQKPRPKPAPKPVIDEVCVEQATQSKLEKTAEPAVKHKSQVAALPVAQTSEIGAFCEEATADFVFEANEHVQLEDDGRTAQLINNREPFVLKVKPPLRSDAIEACHLWLRGDAATSQLAFGVCKTTLIGIAQQLALGSTDAGWAFCIQGEKAHANQYVPYGTRWAVDDKIGSYWDWRSHKLAFAHNGSSVGTAFENVAADGLEQLQFCISVCGGTGKITLVGHPQSSTELIRENNLPVPQV